MTEPEPLPSWQRPPFEPGNEKALVHGAHSPRRVAPAAQAVVERLLADPSTPVYLREDPSYRGAVGDLGKSEAIVELLWAFLSQADPDQGPSKRVMSTLDQLHKWLRLLGNQRTALGLTPAGRARLGAVLTDRGRLDLAKVWEAETGDDSDA